MGALGARSQMSYNNYLDVEAAYSAVCDFDDPTCVIVKVCVYALASYLCSSTQSASSPMPDLHLGEG